MVGAADARVPWLVSPRRPEAKVGQVRVSRLNGAQCTERIPDETEAFDLDHMEGMQIAETREDLAHQASDGDPAGSRVADKDEMQAQALAGREPMPTLFGVGGEASMSRAIFSLDRAKPAETVELGQDLIARPRRSVAPAAP